MTRQSTASLSRRRTAAGAYTHRTWSSGFVLLDLSEVATQKWKGFARLGCYILDDESITIRQFTWLDPDQPRGYTATLSCATRDYGAHYELFENVGASLEAMPAAPTDHSREG